MKNYSKYIFGTLFLSTAVAAGVIAFGSQDSALEQNKSKVARLDAQEKGQPALSNSAKSKPQASSLQQLAPRQLNVASPSPQTEQEIAAAIEETDAQIGEIDRAIESEDLVRLANAGGMTDAQYNRLGTLLRKRTQLSVKRADQLLAQLDLEEKKELEALDADDLVEADSYDDGEILD